VADKQDTNLILDYGSCTHPGGKKENQDCCDAFLDVKGDMYCFVIADGLGSYRRGRNAAQLAVESIVESFVNIGKENPGIWLHNVLQEAHFLIKERSKVDASLGRMKTTCAVIIIIHGKAYWASVGDSRIYVVRNNSILHRSKDHSVVQVLLDMGEIKPEEVRSHPDRNRILRVLGMDEDMKPLVYSDGLVLQRGDCILLCTDGFWGSIDDSSIVDFIISRFDMKAQLMLESLFNNIISASGENMYKERHDNLSAQLILVR
jgi:PPM family protein phosphatase